MEIVPSGGKLTITSLDDFERQMSADREVMGRYVDAVQKLAA